MDNKASLSYPLPVQETEIQREEPEFFDFYQTLRRHWRMNLGSYHILMRKPPRLDILGGLEEKNTKSEVTFAGCRISVNVMLKSTTYVERRLQAIYILLSLFLRLSWLKKFLFY